jgi:hypothetical protein
MKRVSIHGETGVDTTNTELLLVPEHVFEDPRSPEAFFVHSCLNIELSSNYISNGMHAV